MSDDQSAEGTPAMERGPDSGEDASLGSAGDGADSDGQDGVQSDENSQASPDHDNQTDAESSDDALINALAAGKLDELDADGKPKAKPKEVEESTSDDAEESDGDDKKPEETKAESLDPEEQKLLEKARTKGERKELDKLFKERRALRPAKAFADGVIEHAKAAGLIKASEDGKVDTKGLYELIEQERFLRTRSPDQQAAFLRSLADQIAPVPKAVEPPKPAELTQDLRDAIDAGYLSDDEAKALAEKRAKPAAKAPEKQQEDKAEPEKPERQSGPPPEATQKGYAAVAEIAKSYQERFPSDYDPIAAAVEKRIAPLIAKSPPETWGELAKMAYQAVIAERRPAVKKPAQTTRPSNPPQKRSGDFLSEAEERDLLAKGKLA